MLKLCKRCFTMKNIKGKRIICKVCEDEVESMETGEITNKNLLNKEFYRKQGKKQLLKELLNKKYVQLYNANTILLLRKFKEKND